MESPVKSPAGSPEVTKFVSAWEKRPRKFKNVLIQVTLFILVMELAERLSYYGINQGLMNFMTKHLEWPRTTASALKSTWTSICYLTPLFGAYMADERWGRFKVILVFGIWYFVGDLLVAIAAHPSVEAHKSLVNPIFVIGLFLGIGVGTGAIKSNVVTFGADQFDPEDENEVKQKETYFSYFYLCINLGATVSYGYLSILCVDGGGFISAEYGYFGTFMICAIVMGLALCSLVFGRSRYVHQKPTDRAVSTLTRLIFAAPKFHWKGGLLLYGTLFMFSSIVINVVSAATSTHETVSQLLAYLAALAVLVGIISWIVCGMDPSFLDGGKKSNGGIFDDRMIEGYKALVRVFPFNAFTIVWNCVYDQIDANFQSITQQCDLRWHTNSATSSQIPGAMLGVFDPIVIVVAIPIIDTCIYPLYTKLAGKRPSYYGKMTAGFILAVVGVVWAGIFEMIRRNSGAIIYDGQEVLDDGSDQPMNNISFLWAIPMYIIVGLAECFINVAAMDACYASVPLSLKSTAQAVNLLMTSMGSALTSAFTLMFGKYTPSDNLNEGHLEYMYFVMGVVGLVNVLGFIWVMIKMNFGMHDSPPYVEPDEEAFVIDDKAAASLQ